MGRTPTHANVWAKAIRRMQSRYERQGTLAPTTLQSVLDSLTGEEQKTFQKKRIRSVYIAPNIPKERNTSDNLEDKKAESDHEDVRSVSGRSSPSSDDNGATVMSAQTINTVQSFAHLVDDEEDTTRSEEGVAVDLQPALSKSSPKNSRDGPFTPSQAGTDPAIQEEIIRYTQQTNELRYSHVCNSYRRLHHGHDSQRSVRAYKLLCV